jgi:hypothetical protein
LVTVKEAALVSSKEWTGLLPRKTRSLAARGRLRHRPNSFCGPNREDAGFPEKIRKASSIFRKASFEPLPIARTLWERKRGDRSVTFDRAGADGRNRQHTRRRPSEHKIEEWRWRQIAEQIESNKTNRSGSDPL